MGVANTHKSSAELLDAMNHLITIKTQQQGIKGPNGNLLKFDEVILTRIVIYGLNIEILLKAICLADNSVKPNGHDWVTLFNLLPTKRQQEIISELKPDYQADFANLLSKNKDIFIKWRYTYEYPTLSCDISFVKNFADALSKVAIRIK